MRKEWILTDEEKRIKRKKIERNRLIKQQAHITVHQQHNHDIIHSNLQTNASIEVCLRHKIKRFTLSGREISGS